MDKLTGAGLAARRELLGYTQDGLAAYLGVQTRTVRRWESGRHPVPARIVNELSALEHATAAVTRQVDHALSTGTPATLPTWQTDADFAAARLTSLDVPVGAGARWWRHIAARIATTRPDVTITTATPHDRDTP